MHSTCPNGVPRTLMPCNSSEPLHTTNVGSMSPFAPPLRILVVSPRLGSRSESSPGAHLCLHLPKIFPPRYCGLRRLVQALKPQKRRPRMPSVTLLPSTVPELYGVHCVAPVKTTTAKGRRLVLRLRHEGWCGPCPMRLPRGNWRAPQNIETKGRTDGTPALGFLNAVNLPRRMASRIDGDLSTGQPPRTVVETHTSRGTVSNGWRCSTVMPDGPPAAHLRADRTFRANWSTSRLNLCART